MRRYNHREDSTIPYECNGARTSSGSNRYGRTYNANTSTERLNIRSDSGIRYVGFCVRKTLSYRWRQRYVPNAYNARKAATCEKIRCRSKGEYLIAVQHKQYYTS